MHQSATPRSPFARSPKGQRCSSHNSRGHPSHRSDRDQEHPNTRSKSTSKVYDNENKDPCLQRKTKVSLQRKVQCTQVNIAKTAISNSTYSYNFHAQVKNLTRPLQELSVNHLNENRRRQAPPTKVAYSPTSFSEPPSTDPTSTAILWRQVRIRSLSVMAPPKPRKLVSPPSTVTTSRSRSGKSVSSDTTRSTPNQNSTTKDTDFREKVLRPRGIVITDRGGLQGQQIVLDTPYSYFQTPTPPSEISYADHYNGEHGSPGSPIKSNVWLNLNKSNIDDMAQEYQIMNARRLCEDEFASYAKGVLLKRDRRNLDPEVRCWTVDRMVKPTLKPGRLLEVPPILGQMEASVASFRFHLLPDCMYWISLQGFNPDYRSAIKGLTYVIDDSEVTCPYMTVEFKKDGSSKDQAENQVAGASALILYNRYKLRLQCLEAEKASINQHSFKDVMHFGLTLCSANCEIFLCQPTLTEKGEWKGCSMSLIGSYNCTRPREARFVAEWVNEIHFWGMQRHGKSCEDDVKGYLRATLAHKARVSDIAHRLPIPEDTSTALSSP
jgi:hypothetical protein